MYSRRLRQLVLIISFLVIPALILRANSKNAQDLNAFDRFILRITSPIQSALSRAAWAIHDVGSQYFSLVGVKKENQELLKENQELKAQLESSRLDRERAERLEQLLKLKGDFKMDGVFARVIARDSFPLLGRTIQVRFEKESGEVKPGMPVVAPGGVVGKVLHVYADSYATIQLIVDSRFAVPIQLPHSKSQGILRGMGEDRKLQIEYIDPHDEVSMGDPVLTTGIGTKGREREIVVPTFPPQLFVGQVSLVTKSLSGLDQKIQVNPGVNFKEVREVLILLRAPAPKDPDANPSSRRPN